MHRKAPAITIALMAIVVGDVVALHMESPALIALNGMNEIPLFGLVTAIDGGGVRTVVWENGTTATVAGGATLLDKIEQATLATRETFEGKVVRFNPASFGGGYVSAEQSGPTVRVYSRDPEDTGAPIEYVAWVSAPQRAYEARATIVQAIDNR